MNIQNRHIFRILSRSYCWTRNHLSFVQRLRTLAPVNLKSLTLALSFFLLVCFNLLSQTSRNDFYFENGFRFSHLSVDEGLSPGAVNSFYKEESGFLWIGTRSGLNRYDGYTIQTFVPKPSNDDAYQSIDCKRIFQDPLGNIWVETPDGINIFDPSTQKFSSEQSKILEKLEIPGTKVLDIKKDSNNNYWFIHENGTLTKYLTSKKKSVQLTEFNNSILYDERSIAAISEDSQGNFWILSNNGLLERLNCDNLEITKQITQLQQVISNTGDYQLAIDHNDNLWINHYDDQGLYFFDIKNNSLRTFSETTKGENLSSNRVSSLEVDENGEIWVGTDHGGINVINPETFTIDQIQTNKEFKNGLSHNSITSLYKDPEGIIWIGTYKNGIDYYHPDILRFPLYTKRLNNPASLPFNDVNVFEEDAKGNLYIGTNGGGLLYWNRETNSYKQFLHDSEDPNSISSNVIVSLLIDSKNDLWVGTYLGGLNKRVGNGFKSFKNNPDDSLSVAENNIWELLEDSQGNFWVGTINHGLELFDREKEVFYHSGHLTNPFDLENTYISALAEDSQGNIWVGGSRGIDIFNPKTGDQRYYTHNYRDTTSLSNDFVFSILSDSENRVWIGTQKGLDLYNRSQEDFHHYTTKDGLQGDKIVGIVEDNKNSLWLTSYHGISQLDLSSGEAERTTPATNFRIYKEEDGLQDNLFNENAIFKTSTGSILVGGLHGYNLFNPENFKYNSKKPRVVFTEFSLFNEPVLPQESIDDRVILKDPVYETSKITLNHDENIFSISFAALDFFQPSKNKYRYKLEGFDTQWQTAGSTSRKVTYTNLDPGTYRFLVKASNNDLVWTEEPEALNIEILPPFYKTIWAYILYFILIVTLLYYARRRIIYREQLHFQREQEKREAAHLHKMDEMRIRFFTHLSQEFKTPLSRIINPINKLKQRDFDPQTRDNLKLIDESIKQLLHLINQVLELGNTKETELNNSSADIYAFVEESVEALRLQAEAKGIEYSYSQPLGTWYTEFDTDKLDKIIFNLVSNAIKFTPSGGSIYINLEKEKSKRGQEFKTIMLRIKDTGLGISLADQPRIFERFYKGEHNHAVKDPGSGIGLTLVKQYAHLLGGTIEVESMPGRGSCFTFSMDLLEFDSSIKKNPSRQGKLEAADERQFSSEKPSVLIINEDQEILNELIDKYKPFFSLFMAKDKNTGWKKVLSVKPDLVLAEHSPSKLDAVAFCAKLKEDARTKHIPFILVTAEKSEDLKLKALNTGVNDYIEKPFQFEMLRSRIKNLIDQRNSLQKIYSKKIEVSDLNENSIESEDEKFTRKILGIVEKNYASTDFSVEKLAGDLGVSRSFLYKKTVALFDKSPSELITDIRLEKGKELLKKSQLTIAEIAFKTGFNNPKYFTKNFKRKMKMLPSAYKTKYTTTS